MDSLGRAWRDSRALDRRIWVLAVARAVNTMGFSMAMVFMAIYLVDERHESGRMYGLLYCIASLLQGVTQRLAGDLSDRIGRRPVMGSALVARSLVFAWLGTAVLLDLPVAVVAAFFIVSSMLRGGFEPVAFAVVADIAPPDQRTAAFGLQRMGINLGFAVGPALGGLLAKVMPYGAVFWVSAPIILATGVSVLRIDTGAAAPGVRPRPERSSFRATLASLRRRPELALLLGCAFIAALCQTQIFSTLSTFAATELDLSPAMIGAMYSINGVGVLLLQLPAVAFIATLGASRALIGGSILFALSFLGIGAAGGFSLLGASVLVLTVGEVLISPAQQTTIADLAEPERMGHAFGTLGSMQMAGIAVAPLFGGFAYDHLRKRHMVMWGVVAATGFLLTLGYVAFALVRRARAARVPAGQQVRAA